MSHSTATELSLEFNLSLSHLAQLEKRGILPRGKKEGKVKLYPTLESRLILASHEPGKRWAKESRAAQGQTAINWLEV